MSAENQRAGAAQAANALPGVPFPLGATVSAGGTNFAVASEVADRVDLCLFDPAGAETARVPLTDVDAGVWQHNEANGEANRDGTNDNSSWNCGAEGPTDDPGVLALRARQSRAMLATLLLSFGIPMLLGGDELGRSQRGNNNAYCQDNELTWHDWSAVDKDLRAFTRQLLRFAMPPTWSGSASTRAR